MDATEAGTVLGTTAYMSPEQAKGMPVDKRTDIWAFGVVWYEMLAGRKPFSGATATEVLAAVLEREPDWSNVPAKVRPLLHRCLAKDARRRLRDIGDAMPLLDLAAETQLATRPEQRRKWLWPAVAALLLVTLAAGRHSAFPGKAGGNTDGAVHDPAAGEYKVRVVSRAVARRPVSGVPRAEGGWPVAFVGARARYNAPQELAETEFLVCGWPFHRLSGRRQAQED